MQSSTGLRSWFADPRAGRRGGSGGLLTAPGAQVGASTTCPPFYLYDEDGDRIDPVHGINTDQPISTRQTCGKCHDYETITRGYHFQQGWDELGKNANPQTPWVLSPGMLGKY